MIERLVKLLDSNKKIFAWNIVESKKSSYQLYFIKQTLDMNREVNANEYKVTIFIKEKSKDGEKMGKVSFDVYDSLTNEELESKIEEKISFAKFTLANAYNLPKKASLKPSNKDASFNGKTLKEAAFIVADAIFEADKYDKGYINSTEIYINSVETRYIDSNDNDFNYVNQSGEVEFVVTWVEKEEEIELYKYLKFNTLDNEYLAKEADNMLQEASNRIKAIKTPSLSNTKLVIVGEDVKEYFYYFADKLRVENIFNHMSNYNVGKIINNDSTKADLITIKLEPTLNGSTIGMPFDLEGVVLKKLSIIEKGVATNTWGCNDKSQYLKKNPNGMPKNIICSGGSLTNDELEEENYVEVISFSGFEIDQITGDFGAEIRLGYLYQKGKEKQIITGGSVSGNVNDSVNLVRFSNEVEQINNFIGPKKVLLDKVKFNKGD